MSAIIGSRLGNPQGFVSMENYEYYTQDHTKKCPCELYEMEKMDVRYETWNGLKFCLFVTKEKSMKINVLVLWPIYKNTLQIPPKSVAHARSYEISAILL